MRFPQHELEGPLPANRPCPICGRVVLLGRLSPNDTFDVDCEYCGRFTITEEALRHLWHAEDTELPLLPFLSAHTRQAAGRNERIVVTTDWHELAARHAETTVSEKVGMTLRFLADRSEFPGAVIAIPHDRFANLPPLLDARSTEELSYLLRHLVGLRVVDDSASVQNERRYVVTVGGWQQLQDKSRRSGGTPGRCFVAMSFDPSLLDAYESGIVPAVKFDCGMEPIRVDRVVHNDKICDRILAEIRLAQFVIADFTGQRSSVYFEAGFALALGRPVIWICHERDRDSLHRNFDTRQYPHTFWTDASDLRAKLRDRLRAMTLLPATERI